MLRKNIANIITGIRIVLCIILFFLEPFSFEFYALYLFAGISDVLDGYLARRMKIESEYGSKLDSIADVVMFMVMTIKMFPILKPLFTTPLVIAVLTIFVVRITTWLVILRKTRDISPLRSTFGEKTGKLTTILPLHTTLNKAAGILLFCFPFVVRHSNIEVYLVISCVVASAAALHELYLNISVKK